MIQQIFKGEELKFLFKEIPPQWPNTFQEFNWAG
jgi:hypothetical protein